MGKCPFWSSGKNVVNCFSECVMMDSNNKHEECVFKEFLISDVQGYSFDFLENEELIDLNF